MGSRHRSCQTCRVTYDTEDLAAYWCAGCAIWSRKKPRPPEFHLFRCERCDEHRWTRDPTRVLCRTCRYVPWHWQQTTRECFTCKGQFRATRDGRVVGRVYPFCSPECEAGVPEPRTPRGVHMVEARKLGSHTEDEWLDLVDAHGRRCAYCHGYDLALTKDHVVPVSRGGSDAIENLVPACRTCNSRKRTLTAREFLSRRGAA